MPSTQTPPLAGAALDPTAVRPPIDDATIERVEPAQLRAAPAKRLKAEGYTMLLDIGAVDYLERAPRFDVVYHLLKLPLKPASVAEVGNAAARCACCAAFRRASRPLPTRHGSVEVGRLGRARNLRSVRHRLRRAPGSAAHSDAARLGRLSAAQGLSAARSGARAFAAPGVRAKTNVAAGTPPSGRTLEALQEQIAKARGRRRSQ